MADGGLFRGPQGRRQRRSAGRHSVDRALSASALLPTVAFAGLGTLTVLLVAQMGMSPLGAVVGPSAHDGGHAVTTPRMSVSTDPTRLNSLRSMSSRAATRASGPAAGGPEVVVTVTLPHSWQAPRVAVAVREVSPNSAPQGERETAPERAHGKSHAAQLAAKAHKAATRTVKQVKQVKQVKASRATKPLMPTRIPA